MCEDYDHCDGFSRLTPYRANIRGNTENTPHPAHPPHIDNFCRLVRHCGTDYQCLLTFEEIRAELSAEDRAELETLDPHNRRAWAELLAYRLTKDRTVALQQGKQL